MDLDRLESECKGCANKDTSYCVICSDEDFYRTQEEKEYEEWLCDMMCGKPVKEDKDGHSVIWLGDSDDFID